MLDETDSFVKGSHPVLSMPISLTTNLGTRPSPVLFAMGPFWSGRWTGRHWVTVLPSLLFFAVMPVSSPVFPQRKKSQNRPGKMVRLFCCEARGVGSRVKGGMSWERDVV